MWLLVFLGMLVTCSADKETPAAKPESREIMMLEITREQEPDASSTVEKRSPQLSRQGHILGPQGRGQGNAQAVYGASPGQFIISTGAQGPNPGQQPQQLAEGQIPPEYLHLLQELQTAQQQHSQQQVPLGGAQAQQGQQYVAPRPRQQVSPQHQSQLQLITPEGADYVQQQRGRLPFIYGEQQARLQQSYQDLRLAHQKPGETSQLQVAQQLQYHPGQNLHNARLQATLSGSKEGLQQHQAVQYTPVSALADSSFEKELAQLVAANRAQEVGTRPLQKQRFAVPQKQQVRQQFASQPQFTFLQQEQQQVPQHQLPQHQVPQHQVIQQQQLELTPQFLQFQGQPEYPLLKQPRKPQLNHQYHAETSHINQQPNLRQQPQIIKHQYEAVSQYERSGPVVSQNYDRQTLGQSAVRVVEAPQLQYAQPQPQAQAQVQYKSQPQSSIQQPQYVPRYQQKEQSVEDQEFIQTLLDNPRQGLFSGSKSTKSGQAPSRSSIYVTQSTGVHRRPNGVTIEEIEQTNQEIDAPGTVPQVRIPGPKDNRPLTQAEFQALVDAGFSVTAVPVPVPVPAQEGITGKSQYQGLFQSSFSTPVPTNNNYQKEQEVLYRPEESTPATSNGNRVKQHYPQLRRRPQYRLNEESSNQEQVTYLLPLDGQESTNYGTKNVKVKSNQ